MNDLVSVVMATHNGERYLFEQMQSVLMQSYKNIEVLVVDDASTDRTLALLKDFSDIDPRISIHPSDRNLGFVANFERGLTLAKGEFIALSDQDDVFHRDTIELLVKLLQSNPRTDMVISDLNLIDENNNIFIKSMWHYNKLHPESGHPFQQLIYKNFATGCAMMIRRRLLDSALPFPTCCSVHDWWLAVLAASEGRGGILLVEKPLTSYRQHASNVVGAGRLPKRPSIKNIYIRFTNPNDRFDKAMVRYSAIKLNLNRIDGYLNLNIWSSSDRLTMEKYRKILQGYLEDLSSSIFKRLSYLPGRLKYAVLSRSFRTVSETVYFSIFPKG